MVKQETMKTTFYIALLGLLLGTLAGCTTYNTGAPADDHYSTYGTGAASGSPTMRPGMDPSDVRDPTYLTRPAQRWPAGP